MFGKKTPRHEDTAPPSAVLRLSDGLVAPSDVTPTAPLPLPGHAGMAYVTARTLAIMVADRPLRDVLLDLYDALIADHKGTRNRLTDAIIRAEVPDLAMDMVYEATGKRLFIGDTRPMISRDRFQQLLDEIAAGHVWYVSNRYEDDLPNTFVQATDRRRTWTAEQWGDDQAQGA